MDNNKILSELVDSVKKQVKESGGRITQEEMANKLGITRSYLSQMIRGTVGVNSQFIAFFKEVFKDYLPDLNSVTRDDITIVNVAISVLLRAMAKMQNKIPAGEDPTAYLAALKLEIQLISTEKHVSEQSLVRSLDGI